MPPTLAARGFRGLPACYFFESSAPHRTPFGLRSMEENFTRRRVGDSRVRPAGAGEIKVPCPVWGATMVWEHVLCTWGSMSRLFRWDSLSPSTFLHHTGEKAVLHRWRALRVPANPGDTEDDGSPDGVVAARLTSGATAERMPVTAEVSKWHTAKIARKTKVCMQVMPGLDRYPSARGQAPSMGGESGLAPAHSESSIPPAVTS